jgi:hypothetical protein
MGEQDSQEATLPEAQPQPPSAAAGEPQYYIEDGVHRAVALRELQVSSPVPAVLFEPGKPPRALFVSLGQLHSPRATVSSTPDARHDLPAMLLWLATGAGRARMLPLHLQPLGAPGQTASVPLAQVQIVP